MRFHPLCAAAALLMLSLQPLPAGSIYQLVVFGDSLSDNGNASAALASVGQTLGNYASNGFTDGPQTLPATSGPYGIWIDQFAAMLGVPDPQPFVVNTPWGAGGMLSTNFSATNFAVGSALAGNNPNFSPNTYLNPANPQVPGTTNQVQLFLAFNGGHASPDNLYVFWAGANNIYQSLGNVSSFLTFPVVAKKAADDIAQNIATLAAAGAKRFLWLNLPSLGRVPYVNDNPNFLIRDLGKPAADAASLTFNDELAWNVALLERKYKIDIIIVNTNALFNSIVAAPSKYGFVDVKDAGWCGIDGVTACRTDNPNQFLFWDELHPTTAGHKVLAQYAYTYVVRPF